MPMTPELAEIAHRARIYKELRVRAHRLHPDFAVGHAYWKYLAGAKAYLELILADYRVELKKRSGQL